MAELWRAQRYLQRGYYSSSGSWNNGGKFTVKNSVLRHHSVVPSEGRFRAGSDDADAVGDLECCF